MARRGAVCDLGMDVRRRAALPLGWDGMGLTVWTSN